jgi:hypothetical protein
VIPGEGFHYWILKYESITIIKPELKHSEITGKIIAALFKVQG